MARDLFVERIQTFYTACITEMSRGSAMRRKRPKVSAVERQQYRTEQENRPTLSQWFKIKVHVERHYYKTSWILPSRAFLSWISGLRPYLQQRTLREEIRTALEELVTAKKISLKGRKLNDRNRSLCATH